VPALQLKPFVDVVIAQA